MFNCLIPRVGDKELSRVGHQLASCSLLIFYVLMYDGKEIDNLVYVCIELISYFIGETRY